MNSRFVAVPVGKGDAFFLEVSDRRILVDGGQATHGFSETFREATKATMLDVLVCTHADADHANGVLGLLSTGSTPIEEVWLPGRWTDRLQDIAADPAEFLYELATNCADADADTLEEHAASLGGREERGPEGHQIAKTPDGPSDFGALEDAVAEADAFPKWGHPLSVRWEIVEVMTDIPQPKRKRLLWEAIETAERVLKIAHWAVQRGSKIRWFDFEEFQKTSTPSGGDPDMRPMNSVELTGRPRRPKSISALDYLSLSVANRESLVFLARDSSSCGVLFSADSDFAFELLSERAHSLIATAPHHGAESNDLVYEHVSTWAQHEKIHWVRSDCRAKSRPGKGYLDAVGQRFCTICNPPSRPKDKVVLQVHDRCWTSSSAACECRAHQ